MLLGVHRLVIGWAVTVVTVVSEIVGSFTQSEGIRVWIDQPLSWRRSGL
jgi:hypothetical protein